MSVLDHHALLRSVKLSRTASLGVVVEADLVAFSAEGIDASVRRIAENFSNPRTARMGPSKNVVYSRGNAKAVDREVCGNVPDRTCAAEAFEDQRNSLTDFFVRIEHEPHSVMIFVDVPGWRRYSVLRFPCSMPSATFQTLAQPEQLEVCHGPLHT